MYKFLFLFLLIFTGYYLLNLENKNIETEEYSSINVDLKRVVDGDTFIAIVSGKEERIRIIGIDTPESVDPRRPVECFGKEASKKSEELFGNKNIIIEEYENRDKHGRILAYVNIGGIDFGEEMIKQGYAVSYKKYPHNRLDHYNSLEKEAKENNVGLWNENSCN